MSANNRWDEGAYQRYMLRTQELYSRCKQFSLHLQKPAADGFWLDNVNYDPNYAVNDAIERFNTATARANALYQAMEAYWKEYTDMLGSSQNTMDAVTVENENYGTFEGLVAGGAAAVSAVYAGSVACQFHQSGFDFHTDFNDVASFVNNPNYEFFEGVQGLAEIGSWQSHTVDIIWGELTGEDLEFAEKIYMNALLGSLAEVPGYEPEEVDGKPNWGYLGEQIGMPGLGKDIEKLFKWLASVEGTVDYDDLTAKISEVFLKSGGDNYHVCELIEDIGEHERLGDLFGLITKVGFSFGDAAELILEVYFNMISNHCNQIQYLNGVDEALAMAGYDQITLRSVLQEIREEFESDEVYFLNTLYDKVEKTARSAMGDVLGQGVDFAVQMSIQTACSGMPDLASAASKLSVTKYADIVLDGVSMAVEFAGKDQIAAVETIQGVQMYTEPLIRSYNRYMEMVDAGVADAEDVANAESLFQLIRASKLKEYEAMLTLQSHGELADELREKYNMLERMTTVSDFNTITGGK